jgi:hypothetical protein
MAYANRKRAQPGIFQVPEVQALRWLAAGDLRTFHLPVIAPQDRLDQP